MGDNMKKMMIVFVVLSLLLSGCQKGSPNKEDTTDLQYDEYMTYIEKFDDLSQFQEVTGEFSVQVVLNETNKGNYRYDVIIDTPTIAMYAIKAVAYIPGDEQASYPTIGILETEEFTLLPGVVDKENNIYKGINLSGIAPKIEETIYLCISFYSDAEKMNLEERLIEVKVNDAS